MKKLPPSLREKRRYMAFEVFPSMERSALIQEILLSTRSLYGDVETSEIKPWLMDFDGKYGIIRCIRDKTEEMRAALASLPFFVYVITLSGTIKKARVRLDEERRKNGHLAG